MITRVNKLMSENVISLAMGTTVLDAKRKMNEKDIRHLPIVDELGDVVGILSARDLGVIENPSSVLVETLMRTPVEFVEHDFPITEAIKIMLDRKISCLLITSEASVAGIITTDDLLQYLHQLLMEEAHEKPGVVRPERLQTIGKVADALSNVGI